MISKLIAGLALMAFCVVVHATGVTTAARRWRHEITSLHGFWPGTWLFIRVAVWLILLHLTEIGGWAVYYVWRDAIPDMTSALYFSAVTYTTTGYGDLVLPQEWRLVGAVEALTGILMCGWSTGFFFALVSRMIREEAKPMDLSR